MEELRKEFHVKTEQDTMVNDRVPEGEYEAKYVGVKWFFYPKWVCGKVQICFEIIEGPYSGERLTAAYNARIENGHYIVKPKSRLFKLMSHGVKSCKNMNHEALDGWIWKIYVVIKVSGQTGQPYSWIREVEGPIGELE